PATTPRLPTSAFRLTSDFRLPPSDSLPSYSDSFAYVSPQGGRYWSRGHLRRSTPRRHRPHRLAPSAAQPLQKHQRGRWAGSVDSARAVLRPLGPERSRENHHEPDDRRVAATHVR